MVTIAILVSRVEALCVASMLEAQGIAVHVGASHHASTEVISLALGGHRLWIAKADYQAASDLIREAGTADHWEFSRSMQRAVLRLMAFWAVVFVLPFMIISAIEWENQNSGPLGVVFPIFSLFSLPVNPQGSGDYYLAPPSA
ncbi:DUF2007 domain-containing protein [Pontixanthobacter aquaemixtae]|uniref:DUF2007 domain-containing protein n=1 Tax=Pontixanthobacter aquaemixtae TaxID=1958940 RepID=A0A844ZU58_9SPHN|nr:DUF2007 domain-containing protein [Pontixanthobacter aquaemixtae]MXO91415.1 hypothetical protein [Pontixanthobacter aquaemixtae]